MSSQRQLLEIQFVPSRSGKTLDRKRKQSFERILVILSTGLELKVTKCADTSETKVVSGSKETVSSQGAAEGSCNCGSGKH
jgi:hypothetical protein